MSAQPSQPNNTEQHEDGSNNTYKHTLDMPNGTTLHFADPNTHCAPLQASGTGVRLTFDRDEDNAPNAVYYEEVSLAEISTLLANEELDYVKYLLGEVREGYKMINEAIGKGQSVSEADRANIDYTTQCLLRGLQQHQEAAFRQTNSGSGRRNVPIEELFGVLTMSEEGASMDIVNDMLDSLKI